MVGTKCEGSLQDWMTQALLTLCTWFLQDHFRSAQGPLRVYPLMLWSSFGTGDQTELWHTEGKHSMAIVFVVYLFDFFCFCGTQRCSRATSSSALRYHVWRCSEDHMELNLVNHMQSKSNTLPMVLFGPFILF